MCSLAWLCQGNASPELSGSTCCHRRKTLSLLELDENLKNRCLQLSHVYRMDQRADFWAVRTLSCTPSLPLVSALIRISQDTINVKL
jgi:hypothetical protein